MAHDGGTPAAPRSTVPATVSTGPDILSHEPSRIPCRARPCGLGRTAACRAFSVKQQLPRPGRPACAPARSWTVWAPKECPAMAPGNETEGIPRRSDDLWKGVHQRADERQPPHPSFRRVEDFVHPAADCGHGCQAGQIGPGIEPETRLGGGDHADRVGEGWIDHQMAMACPVERQCRIVPLVRSEAMAQDDIAMRTARPAAGQRLWAKARMTTRTLSASWTRRLGISLPYVHAVMMRARLPGKGQGHWARRPARSSSPSRRPRPDRWAAAAPGNAP